MKKYPAIATLEFKDISMGIQATDALIKKSPIGLLKSGTISHGRYLTLIGGTTAAVEESYYEALYRAQENIIDHVFLPDVHPQVLDAVLGKRVKCGGDAIAIVETVTASCNIRATELALKGTSVEVVELRLADSLLDGKAVSILHGELHDIEAAVDIAVGYLKQKQFNVVHQIISAPHEALARHINAGTVFGTMKPLELDGERE